MRLQIQPSEYKRFQITYGARCSVLYDLKIGQAYHLNNAATRHLKAIITKPNGNSLLQIPENIFRQLTEIQFLQQEGSLNSESIEFDTIPSRPLKKIWIELTNKCNQKCIHCYASASPNSSDGLDSSYIYQFLKWVFLLGCEAIQFTGGEPLLKTDLALFCDLSKKNGIKEIEVFSNLSISNRRLLDKIIESNVIVSTTILAPDAETHDRLTRSHGAFNRMVSNIRYLQQAGVPVNASIILMSETEDRYNEIIQFCKSINVHFGEPDPVRPFGRGKNEKIKCQKYQNIRCKPVFEATPRSFLYSKYFNSCWGNMLFLRYDGKVVPCPHARDLVLGDVKNNSFDEILEKASSLSWSVTLEAVDTCKDCEFRYLCTDCRPLAYEGDVARLLEKNHMCLYNPYEGKWQNDY